METPVVMLTGPSLDELLAEWNERVVVRESACGCAAVSGVYVRECDECLIAWVSTQCRHAAPKCPRCGEVTE